MLIIAHRGASNEFPENSLLAFEHAIAQGADGIELDVHYHAASEQYIVLHNFYLDKTTDGHGHYDQYSLEQLTQLSLGENQYLSTLPQALALIQGRVLVNIELKTIESSPTKLTYQLKILDKILSHAIDYQQFSREQLILSSFNHVALNLSTKQLRQYRRASLISHIPHNLNSLIEPLKIDMFNTDINCLNRQLVTNCQQLGLSVWVYTVDRIEDIQRCWDYGVDGIFTNSPQQTRQMINALND